MSDHLHSRSGTAHNPFGWSSLPLEQSNLDRRLTEAIRFTSTGTRGDVPRSSRAVRAANARRPPPRRSAASTPWAPAATATIHPGVQTYTEGAQCTANFVFTDGAGNTYVGYAAHCAGTGEATDTNGCDAGSLPLGTEVDFNEGGSLVSEGTRVGGGTLAYSSWLTMQARGESDANTCAYNDLALVKVDAADVAKVNPSDPVLGRPGRHQHRRHRRRRHGLLLRQLQPARRHHRALSPKHGRQPRHRGRGLDPPASTPSPRASPATRAAPSSTPRATRSAPCPRSASPRCRRRTASATSPTSWPTRRPLRHRRPGPGPRHRAVHSLRVDKRDLRVIASGGPR